MSAIKQYIDLFNECKGAINSKSAAILNRLRESAYALLAGDGVTLPKKGDENYEITDIDAMFAPDYGVNINRIDMNSAPIDSFRCDVPNMDASLYFLYNDTFMVSKRSDSNLPNGVILTSLNQAATDYPELVGKYYGKIADMSSGEVALNTLLVQDGLFLYIPDGVVMERPIQLINILNSTSPLLANRRVLVVVGERAEAKMLICDHTQNSGVDYLSSQVFEIFVGEGATFDLYDIEEGSDTTNRVCSIYAEQSKSSNLLINGITLTNGVTRNNINVKISGEYAECKLQGMSISSKNQHIDNCTYISHDVPNTRSSELFKYVLDDNSKGAFVGRVYVAKGAIKTEAYQSNKNLCVSNDAKIHTKI
ncbi:MAG: SufD family Fe-S cluster assembly protein, partial [Bacteroidales bacterium]